MKAMNEAYPVLYTIAIFLHGASFGFAVSAIMIAIEEHRIYKNNEPPGGQDNTNLNS